MSYINRKVLYSDGHSTVFPAEQEQMQFPSVGIIRSLLTKTKSSGT